MLLTASRPRRRWRVGIVRRVAETEKGKFGLVVEDA